MEITTSKVSEVTTHPSTGVNEDQLGSSSEFTVHWADGLVSRYVGYFARKRDGVAEFRSYVSLMKDGESIGVDEECEYSIRYSSEDALTQLALTKVEEVRLVIVKYFATNENV